MLNRQRLWVPVAIIAALVLLSSCSRAPSDDTIKSAIAELLKHQVPPSPVSQFIGHWTNENPNTGGITRVEIRSESNTIFVHMWGKCHPTDCDWGETTTDISDANDGVLSLTWTFSFSVETQQVSVLSDGRLQVVGHVHYTDDSGRPDRDYTEYYIRE
jgi:Fe-S cluster biogenesis protein NfuA